jgi:hypothetical protein
MPIDGMEIHEGFLPVRIRYVGGLCHQALCQKIGLDSDDVRYNTISELFVQMRTEDVSGRGNHMDYQCPVRLAEHPWCGSELEVRKRQKRLV